MLCAVQQKQCAVVFCFLAGQDSAAVVACGLLLLCCRSGLHLLRSAALLAQELLLACSCLLTTTERPSESFPSTYTQPSRMKGVSTNSDRCKLSAAQ